MAKRKKRTPKRRPPKFCNLREFIEQAIAGEFTAREMIATLDNIEMGIGLDERDRALAEQFGEQNPPLDDENPVFRRGWIEGHEQGLKDAVNPPKPLDADTQAVLDIVMPTHA